MLLFEHQNLKVLQDETTYVQVAGPEGASVLLATPDGRLLVAQEYRPAVRRDVWGLPGGMLLDGETPEACARRELGEEFGAEVGALTYLGAVFPQPGVLYRLVHLFFAEVSTLGQSQPESDERIHPVALSLDELQQRLLAGEAADGELPCALLYARLRGLL
jgi:ADP-ribose pyrophosphatase